MIAQIFIPTAELVMPIGTATNETNAEIETQPLTAETKIRKCLSNSKSYKLFYAFRSLYHYVLFLLKDNLLFHLFFNL